MNKMWYRVTDIAYKHCPFCGENHHNTGTDITFYENLNLYESIVSCGNCKASAGAVMHADPDESSRLAKIAWNMRHE